MIYMVNIFSINITVKRNLRINYFTFTFCTKDYLADAMDSIVLMA